MRTTDQEYDVVLLAFIHLEQSIRLHHQLVMKSTPDEIYKNYNADLVMR